MCLLPPAKLGADTHSRACGAAALHLLMHQTTALEALRRASASAKHAVGTSCLVHVDYLLVSAGGCWCYCCCLSCILLHSFLHNCSRALLRLCCARCCWMNSMLRQL
jgi:hypothetical protein